MVDPGGGTRDAATARPRETTEGSQGRPPGGSPVSRPRAFDGRDVQTARSGSVGSAAPNQEDPHGRHGRKASGRHHDPPIHDRDSRGGAREPACTHRGDALAHQRARRRPLAGRATRHDEGAGALLDDRIRLRAPRGATERAAAVHDRDRRRGHPLHPRALAARGRVAAGHDARLARLGRSSCSRPSARSPTRPRTAATPRTPSTSSCRRYPATASRASRGSSAGTRLASDSPGRS